MITETPLTPMEHVLPETELNIAEKEEPDVIYVEIAGDSGAGEHVANKDMAPGLSVEPSRGSEVGSYFVAANGDKIANEGQMTIEAQPEDVSGFIQSTFQVAEVTRPR